MGARIAAHLANAGVPSFLLDMVSSASDAASRNKLATAGIEASRKSKPAAFFDSALASLVTAGNFEDDLNRVAEADWIIEAVVEDLEIKRALLTKTSGVAGLVRTFLIHRAICACWRLFLRPRRTRGC